MKAISNIYLYLSWIFNKLSNKVRTNTVDEYENQYLIKTQKIYDKSYQINDIIYEFV